MKPIKVLLVEDNLGDARLVEILVGEVRPEIGDFEFTHVTSVAEASRKLDTGSFDVVLLDLSLPDSRGHDSITRIRDGRPELPIVVLTGNADDTFAMETMQQGVQDYLVKGDGDGRLIARALRYAIERQRVETALRDSEARATGTEQVLADAVESVSEGFVLWDAQDRLLVCNRRYRNLFPNMATHLVPGITFEELAAIAAELHIAEPGERPAWVAQRLKEHRAGSERALRQLPDGRWMQVSERQTACGGIVGLHTDITETKETQDRLNQLATEQDIILQNASVGIVRVVRDIVTWANARFLFIFGMSQSAVEGMPLTALCHEDQDWLRAKQAFGPATPGQRSFRIETKLSHADGSPFWCRVTARAVHPDDPGAGEILIFEDIDDRKRAEEGLRQSEKMYRNILDTTSEGYWRVGADGRTREVNRALCDMLGVPGSELIGRPVLNFVADSSAAAYTEALEALKETHQRVFEISFDTGPDRKLDVLVSATPLSGPDDEPGAFFAFLTDITARKYAERALRESEARFRNLSDTAPVLIWMIDTDQQATYFNRGWIEFTGRPRASQLGKGWLSCLHPDDLQAHAERRKAAARSQQKYKHDFRLRHADGDYRWIHEATVPRFNDSGQFAGFIACGIDVTERKKAEESLRLSATVFENSAEAIMVSGADNTIMAVNPAFSKITEFAGEEAIGRSPDILDSGSGEAVQFQDIFSRVEASSHWEGEAWIGRKGGESFAAWLSISAIRDAAGRIIEYVSLFSDITKRKKAEELIRHQANFDALTDLPNRTLFLDRLETALIMSKRTSARMALMFIDLDRFKWVNDTLGHAAGDQLLQQAAERLISCVRESDTVARLGGDEFTVILPNIHTTGDVERVAIKILDELARMFLVDNTEVFISGSVGVTVYPEDGEDTETLIKNADTAMYRAKEAGRNAFRFFTGNVDEKVRLRLEMENALRRAVENGELSIAYQPIIHMPDNRIVGAEALLRWTHPKLGPMNPAEFIPLAEETGLITQIGEWVLWTICTQGRAWLEDGLALERISVNISPRQCRQENFEQRVRQILERTGYDPHHLTLEITETVIIENTRGSADVLHNLRGMGLHLSIDDFGTGYSSLSYLKRYPFDVVKIDRSFIGEIGEDPADAALIDAIIRMAHGLGLTVVAEGAEDARQVDFLRTKRCDYIQGYYYSRPLPVAEFERFFLDWERTAAAS